MDTLLTKPRCFVFSFKYWDTNRTEQTLCRRRNSDLRILEKYLFGFGIVSLNFFFFWFLILVCYSLTVLPWRRGAVQGRRCFLEQWFLSVAYSLWTVNAVKNFHSFQAGTSQAGSEQQLQLQFWSIWSGTAPVLDFPWGQQEPNIWSERNHSFGLVSDAFLLQIATLQEYFSKQGRFQDLCNPEH